MSFIRFFSRSRAVPAAQSSSAPQCTSSPHINMHVVGARVTAGVDAEPADQIRVLSLDDLPCQTYHATVDGGDFSVAVRVDRHIGRVPVLVLTVTRGAPDLPVMLGSAKSGMDVKLDVSNGLVAVPAGDLLNHQLELVQQLRVHSRVARPDPDLIVVKEITHTQVLRDLQVHISGGDLEKTCRRRLPASNPFGDVSADTVN